MPRFLNRLLALPIAEQNALFAELESRIAANIEQAMEAGTFEVGVETVRADSLSATGRETLYTHPATGAATELIEILRRDRLEPTSADAALALGAQAAGSDDSPVLTVNARSHRAAVVLPAPSRMFDDGGVQERVRLLRPTARDAMAKAELDASNWEQADEAHWRELWQEEIAALPSHTESRFWLAAMVRADERHRLPARQARRCIGLYDRDSQLRDVAPAPQRFLSRDIRSAGLPPCSPRPAPPPCGPSHSRDEHTARASPCGCGGRAGARSSAGSRRARAPANHGPICSVQ